MAYPPPKRSPRSRLNTMGLHLELLEARRLLAGDPAIDPEVYDPSSIIVRFQPEAAAGALAEMPKAFQADGRGFSLLPGLHEIRLPRGISVVEALQVYQSDNRVLYAEPNYTIHITATPNDPQFDALWGLNNVGQTGGTIDADIDAVEAWDLHVASGNTVIAVIDTGVEYTHEDLANNMWVNPGEIPNDGIDNDGNGYVDDIHGYDFRNNDNDPMDDNNHGTHVSGTIAALGNNGIGVAGINWSAQIMALKFISSTGSGGIADAVEAINYAVDNGARISSNSWGFNGGFSQALDDAIRNARDAGQIFVAAAGNGDFQGNGLNNDTTPFWPANHDYDNVVSVAATDHDNQLATFSNYGATTVELGAPGVGILSTTRGNTYSTFNGTSMATPHVAGALALLMDQNPSWSYQELIDRLLISVDPIASLNGITRTGGRLNLAAMVGPDIWGPRVATTSPNNFVFEPFSSVRVTFNEEIDPATFSVGDIHGFSGPLGSITVTSVDPVAGSNGQKFDVTFPTQGELGNYSMSIGPDITDLGGNLMNQDGDTINGEALADQFDYVFDLVPFFAKIDLGTNTSPLANGYQRVSSSTMYTNELGIGWLDATDQRDRGQAFGTELTRDFNFTEQATFVIDVPAEAAIYDLTLTMGDGLSNTPPRDQMGVFLEGLPFDSVNSQPGQYITSTYRVTVADGQLTLLLDDLGGADPFVIVNAIQVDTVGPDTSGPKVSQTDPSPEAFDYMDRITLTFDEVIDPSSFTLADIVNLSGPNGPISAFAINGVSPADFEIVFAPQTDSGDYLLTIGPDIDDVAGNPMNQDGDATNGEPSDDEFSTTIALIQTPPFEKHLDFGTSGSPLAAGYTAVFRNSNYSSAAGHGWLTGSIDSRDRGAGAGDMLSQDFNFTALATFAVDISKPAFYDVTLTMGDGAGFGRDDMGVFLEGVQVDSVTTTGAEIAVNTYNVEVTDGQLTLVLDDLGGDPYVLLNGLDIVEAVPDTTGPSVVGTSPDTQAFGSLDRITVTFDEAIDASTFSVEDVTSLTGPGGSIVPTAVNPLTAKDFEITFVAQSAPGEYSLTLGPQIADLVGNLMDQNGNGTGGEATDEYSTTITLAAAPPFEKHLDFGTGGSPVAAGYTAVLSNSTFSTTTGHGWSAGSIDSRDRGAGAGDLLARDFNFTDLATFLVDLPAAGFYDVTLTMGDGAGYGRDEMGVFMEGVQFDSVTTTGAEIAVNTYQVQVTDGQLTLVLDDLGGSDPYVLINGLDIAEAAGDTSGPSVLSSSPDGELTGSLDRIAVTFDEVIDAATFTVEDVTSLTGPGGAIDPTQVNQLTAIEFEVVFDTQNAAGDYTLTLGPEISDVFGNPMNQDGDSVNGETPDDQFSATITLSAAPFERHLDFGTVGSPLAIGYAAVQSNNTYSQTLGHGWLSGTIDSRDRGGSAGDEVRRDFNFTQLGTFVVDVPAAGLYDVTLTMGDKLGFGRDQMGVFLEGVQFDSVTTFGSQIAVNTYQVQVTDGQLTLLLDDLGGSDPWVLINGMDVVAIAAAQSTAASQPESPASEVKLLAADPYVEALDSLCIDSTGWLEDELLSPIGIAMSRVDQLTEKS